MQHYRLTIQRRLPALRQAGTRSLSSVRLAAATLVLALSVLTATASIQADPAQAPCSPSTNNHYNCTFYQLSPVVNSNDQSVGNLHQGTNWVVCQQLGKEYSLNGNNNNWWAWTEADGTHAWGWVSAVYVHGGDNDGSLSNVPTCNGAHGTPPANQAASNVATANANPTPATSTGTNNSASTRNPAYAPLTPPASLDDGCGRNATHYDGGTHVSRADSHGICVCHGGSPIVDYGPIISDSDYNAQCPINGRGDVNTAPPVSTAGNNIATDGIDPSDISDPSTILWYYGNQDGCGSNATHYDSSGKIHVGQSYYGANSICTCPNGSYVSYTGPVPNTDCSTSIGTTASGAQAGFGVISNQR